MEEIVCARSATMPVFFELSKDWPPSSDTKIRRRFRTRSARRGHGLRFHRSGEADRADGQASDECGERPDPIGHRRAARRRARKIELLDMLSLVDDLVF